MQRRGACALRPCSLTSCWTALDLFPRSCEHDAEKTHTFLTEITENHRVQCDLRVFNTRGHLLMRHAQFDEVYPMYCCVSVGFGPTLSDQGCNTCQTVRQLDRYTDRQTVRQLDGYTHRQIDTQTDKQIDPKLGIFLCYSSTVSGKSNTN